MKTIKQFTILSALSVLFLSCDSDDDSDPIIVEPGAFEFGLIISNEGPFNTGNGSISYINPETSISISDIFATTNPGEELGNIVQSIAFTDEDAYIIANNSNKITVANRATFESIATLESGLENPRFMAVYEGKGFVTNWGDTASDDDDYVAVMDLASNTITSTIPVGLGPERAVVNGNQLFVAHRGAFGVNNVVTIIDADTEVVVDTLIVGDVVDSMQIIGDNLWILCAGKPEFTGDETAGSLFQYNISSGTLLADNFTFELTEHPSDLVNDGSNLFFTLNGAIRVLDAVNPVLPGTTVVEGFFFEIEARDGRLYATDAVDFNSNGTLSIFDAASGIEEAIFEVGIIPSGIYFNE